MTQRAEFLIAYASHHCPVTVRQLYYQAEVHHLPGIDKTEHGYAKVQRQCLDLRRAGLLDYDWIADATRWMRKPVTYDGIADAVEQTATTYRKALWRDSSAYVEVWCEKNALAGVLMPVTEVYDVPLMVTAGFSSETFCYEAVAARGWDDRPYHVYYLGDFDRAGHDAARSLEEKLTRFADEAGVEVIFEEIAVNGLQITFWGLPTRSPKRNSPADRKWPYDVACELDAIPPDQLRSLVEEAINRHLPQDQLKVLKIAEESERELLKSWANALEGGTDG